MKYKFKVGDYVETALGEVGYIVSVEDLNYTAPIEDFLKDVTIRRCIILIKFSSEKIVKYICYDEYLMIDNEYSYRYERLFNRIGKYDFTEKKNTIEPMKAVSMPFDFEYRDSKVMWDKINEIIDYINKNKD